MAKYQRVLLGSHISEWPLAPTVPLKMGGDPTGAQAVGSNCCGGSTHRGENATPRTRELVKASTYREYEQRIEDCVFVFVHTLRRLL